MLHLKSLRAFSWSKLDIRLEQRWASRAQFCFRGVLRDTSDLIRLRWIKDRWQVPRAFGTSIGSPPRRACNVNNQLEDHPSIKHREETAGDDDNMISPVTAATADAASGAVDPSSMSVVHRSSRILSAFGVSSAPQLRPLAFRHVIILASRPNR
ncbi:hypothetical protein VTN02DRAFT_1962 [Thermoascus thermophilus]